MKLTIEEADELTSLVCDRLCRYPYERTEEDLLDVCENCPLVERLLKAVKEESE